MKRVENGTGRRAGAAFLLVALAALLQACGQTASEPVPDKVAAHDRIERMLSSGPAGKVLKERFPDAYAGMLERSVAVEIDPKLTAVEKSNLHYEESVSMRRRNADFAFYAPAATQLAVIDNLRNDTKLVLETYGPEVCGQYLLKAEDALPKMTDAITASIARIRELNILVMAEGRDHSVDREQPTEADAAAFRQAMADGGMPVEELAALITGESDPRACPNSIAFFSALISLPGDAGDRMRAMTVWDFVNPD